MKMVIDKPHLSMNIGAPPTDATPSITSRLPYLSIKLNNHIHPQIHDKAIAIRQLSKNIA